MKKCTRFILQIGVFLFCILNYTVLHAQGNQSQVSGTVTDQDNEPLIGVNILVEGTNNGTSTDFNGEFTLQNVNLNSDVLVISYIGYSTLQFPLDGESSVNITLESDTELLEEIIVVGYGTQSREELTTSVSKLDEKVLENVPYSNLGSAMQGAVSGVRVQSTSGQPGSAPRIIVRGGTSINNPNGTPPLYVVDGVIRPNINNISSDDIESLQVLKDAAATAIYGARGSNGVVVITTKSGKVGSASISYSVDLSLSQPGKLYDLANGRDYLEMARNAMIVQDVFPDASFRLTGPSGFGTGNDLTNNTAYTTQYLTPENEHKLNEGWQSMPDPIDPSRMLIYQETDWQDVLFRTGISQNHHLSASGGTEKAQFSASLGYLDNQGIAITTDMKRYTLNVNGNYNINDKLEVFGIANYTRSVDHQVPNITNIFARAMTLPPTTKYRFEDGTLAPGQAASEANPEYILNHREAANNSEYLTFSFGSNWELLPGLVFQPQASIFNVTNDSYNFQPAYLNGPGNLVDNRSASSSYYKWRQTQIDAVLSYSKSILSDHKLDAKAGFSYYGRNEARLSASGQGASTDLIPTLNASAEPVSISSTVTDQVILGYFGRINYNYDYRYLLSINMRYDGASNLGNKYKWGFFPGVSLGWNLHNESFWDGLPQDLLSVKLRGSYGVNGNIGNLGDFTSQGAYGVGAIYGGMAAIQNTTIPNPELQWERSKTLNFGTDIGLFDKRITLLLDIYRRVTDNLITSLALPPSTGFGSTLTNLGSLENKGVEVELGLNVFPSNSAFQWNLALNASRVKNKILRLPPNGVDNNRIGGEYVWDPEINDYNWLGGLQEGGTMGDYFEYKQIGIYTSDEEAMNAIPDVLKRHPEIAFGGDIIWDDLDNNGIIDDRDRYKVGNEFPTWTGGLSNNFSYKNLSLSVRMDYTVGHTIYNYARAFMNGQWKLNMNLTQEMVDQAWKQQGDITNFPRYDWESARAQFNLIPNRVGQEYYERGDYLALREVTLSYNLPQSILNTINVNRISFNVTGNNLHYFTKYKGLNPEFGGQDYGRYPMPRNFIFGFTISF